MYGVAMAADWPIIGDIARLLGFLMSFIFDTLSRIGIESVGISIIVFTIIIYMLMLPLTIKQQKSMRMQSVTAPEIQAVQKKYAGKKDQASMMKQQEEMKMIHEKYGTSATGGCLPLLIQMPILFALFPVIQNIPRFVNSIGRVYDNVVAAVLNTDGYQQIIETIIENAPATMNLGMYGTETHEAIRLTLYRFQESSWIELRQLIPNITDLVNSTVETLHNYNYFLGVNMSEAPLTLAQASLNPFNPGGLLLAAMIPVIAGLTQFLSVKLNPQPTQQVEGQAGQIANSMKSMIYIMPLFSVFMGFTLPAGLGLYWAVSALVRSAQQLIINRQLRKKPLEEMIKENQERAARKREKKGVRASALNQMATQTTRNVEDKREEKSKATIDKNISSKSVSSNAAPGSLASRANMVSRYNTGQSTKNEPKTDVDKKKKNSGKENTNEK